MSNDNFTNRIRRQYSKLNTKQKEIANFFLESDLSVVFLTTREIAEKVGCSNASVSRFASIIGFDGYTDMQDNIKKEFKNKLNPLIALEDSIDLYEDKDNSWNIFLKSIQTDVETLKSINNYISEQDFLELLEKIKTANKIYVFGVGVERPLAEFLVFRLKRFGLNIKLLTKGSTELYEDLQMINKDDLIISFGFYRYPPELNILFDFANSNNVNSIFITDDLSSPYREKVSLLIAAPRGPIGVMHSLVVPMALLNAIAIALGTNDELKKNMKEMENIREEYNLKKYL